nr:uncharacterized protein LOC124816593 [Hydra vulgaris]
MSTHFSRFFNRNMVKEEYFLLITFCNIGVILNGFGLFVLLKFKRGFDSIQHYILVQLCLIDFFLSIHGQILLSLVFFYPRNINGANFGNLVKRFLHSSYFYMTFLLVFDRYLHLKLNIKYKIYCSKKKVIIVTVCVYVFAGTFGGLFPYYNSDYTILIILGYDFIITAFSIFFYVYAYILFRKQKACRSNQRNRRMFKDNSTSGNRSTSNTRSFNITEPYVIESVAS